MMIVHKDAINRRHLQKDQSNMNELEQPIGIFGGTFDPIHLGHIHLAKKIIAKANLSKIILIPCYKSCHHKKIKASAQHRIQMVKLALPKSKKFVVDDREIKRKNISYMIETLISFRAEYPRAPLCLIMGEDAFAKFTTWHKWQKVLQLAHLIVVDRTSLQIAYQPELLQLISDKSTNDKKDLFVNLAGCIIFLSINPLPIAATKIRESIVLGISVTDLLPKKVWTYILEHDLYTHHDHLATGTRRQKTDLISVAQSKNHSTQKAKRNKN
jgi:nicotinate-nucleotide adenylyltransferase